MGAAAGVLGKDDCGWSEEEIVQCLLPHYIKHPEKCLRVHNALVQLVMLEKERQLSARLDAADAAKAAERAEAARQRILEEERQREQELLSKKARLQQEIETRRRLSLKRHDAQGSAPPVSIDSNGATRFSEEIAQVINMVRSKPTSLLSYAEEHLQSFVDEFCYKDPLNRANTTISTREGRSAVVECMNYLQQAIPVLPIQTNFCLENAAFEFVVALAAGTESALGPVGALIRRHGHWRGAVGQAVAYGTGTAAAVVLSLLIDDGNPERGHRQSIFDSNFLQVGAALLKHGQHGICCVINYATVVLDWSSQQVEDTTVSFSRWTKTADQNEDLFRKVVFSIPNDNIAREIDDFLDARGAVVTINFQPSFNRATIVQSVSTGGSKSTTTLTVTWGGDKNKDDRAANQPPHIAPPYTDISEIESELPYLSKLQDNIVQESKFKAEYEATNLPVSGTDNFDSASGKQKRSGVDMWTSGCEVKEQPWQKLSGNDSRPIRLHINDGNEIGNTGKLDANRQVLVYDMRKT